MQHVICPQQYVRKNHSIWIGEGGTSFPKYEVSHNYFKKKPLFINDFKNSL
jgi:hypothetical protein